MRGHTCNRYSPSIDNGYFHWKITELQLIWHRVCSKLELICSKFWFFSIQSVHLFRSDVMIPWFCGLWFGIFHIPYDFRLELQNLSYKSIICMQRRSIHEPYFFRKKNQEFSLTIEVLLNYFLVVVGIELCNRRRLIMTIHGIFKICV